MKKAKSIGSFGAIFGVAAVLFGSHAGGGFATGNQETRKRSIMFNLVGLHRLLLS